MKLAIADKNSERFYFAAPHEHRLALQGIIEQGGIEMAIELSRRTFLKGATIASLGALGTAGLAGCTAEKEKAADEITWNEEADFVILGFGAAGMGAAKRAAVDNGASAIVLEIAPTAEEAGGGLSCNSGTFPAIGTETMVNCSLGAISENLAKRIQDGLQGEADWLAAQGVEWSEREASSGLTRRAAPIPGRGLLIWQAAYKGLADNENITLHLGAKTTKIIKGADGEAHGVEAEVDGNVQNFKAKKGVVICTGGYASNPEIVQGNHYVALPHTSCNTPYATGDGIFLAAKAGAAALKNLTPALDVFGWSFKKASEDMGTGMIMDEPMFGGSDVPYARVFIDYHGKRFMNEDRRILHDRSSLPCFDYVNLSSNSGNGNLGNGYSHLPMWSVYDSKTVDAGPLFITQDWTWAASRNLYSWSADNQTEVEKGWIYKADTLEELASYMKSKNDLTGEDVAVDPATLVATIEEYNGFCAQGVDPLGKAADYLKPLDTPPYYAVETVPSIGYTVQGLVTDEDSRLLDWNDNPIPRLYAAGDIAQGMRSYQIGCSGAWLRGAFAIDHGITLTNWDDEK